MDRWTYKSGPASSHKPEPGVGARSAAGMLVKVIAKALPPGSPPHKTWSNQKALEYYRPIPELSYQHPGILKC